MGGWAGLWSGRVARCRMSRLSKGSGNDLGAATCEIGKVGRPAGGCRRRPAIEVAEAVAQGARAAGARVALGAARVGVFRRVWRNGGKSVVMGMRVVGFVRVGAGSRLGREPLGVEEGWRADGRGRRKISVRGAGAVGVGAGVGGGRWFVLVLAGRGGCRCWCWCWRRCGGKVGRGGAR